MKCDESFTFLISTDNHLGYKQDDHIRRKDSFMAFREALEIARKKDVDFVLLGGDLFHVNRPSAAVEHKCIKIIRSHMSDKSIDRETSFERIQGNFQHFEKLNLANFEDPKFNVPIPIMTIHGNHDDPTGPNAQSVCEKLATCGLLNYFGVTTVMVDQTRIIEVNPIVLQKGKIKIALYGIGFIPDRKLFQAFENDEVRFKSPPRDTFNILIVHQNRVPHSEGNYISDDTFPKFFHLLIRGHEHDAQKPEKIPNSDVNGIVYQPGSTVATSISTQESAEKRVAIMSVKINDPEGSPANMYDLSYDLFPLKCSRRMLFKDITQREVFDHVKLKDSRRKLTAFEFKKLFQEYVISTIEKLLGDQPKSDRKKQLRIDEMLRHKKSGDDKKAWKVQSKSESICLPIHEKLDRLALPLVRVRLEYKAPAERFDENDVGSMFYQSQIANRDIVAFKKQKLIQKEDGTTENVTFQDDKEDNEDEAEGAEFEVVDLTQERRDTVDAMMENYFLERPESERLLALSITEYTNAIQGSQDDGNVISKVLAEKRTNILKQYKAALKSEEVAESMFNEESKVYEWFRRAFRSEPQKELSDSDTDVELLDD